MAELELTDEERRALGEAALNWVLQYFTDAGEPPVYPTISAVDLNARVTESLPRTPQDPSQVFAQFAALAAFGRKNDHPRMFGYVQSSGNFAAAVGDFLASALNQNVTSWRSAPSATAIELQVLDWVKQFVGCDHFGDGILLGGGSAANLAALQVALRASTSADINAKGVCALPGRPAVYASERVHMSIVKAAALMGIGREALRSVPTSADGRLDVTLLRDALIADRAAGYHPVCVVANAGDVNTGVIDPLEDLADLCAEQAVWLHVDGAYGGFAAAVPRLADAFKGMTRANSVTLDPHKWLFAPLDLGCLLVNDKAALRRTFSQGASYIDVVADREMSDVAFWDVSPELSRRFRALKLWFALKCHGADAFVTTIECNLDLAQDLAARVDASEDFERLAPVPLSIVCFRYMPPGLDGDIQRLNDFNRRLLIEVQREGDAYISNAIINSVFALRACIVNHRTSADDIPRLLAAIRRAASRLR